MIEAGWVWLGVIAPFALGAIGAIVPVRRLGWVAGLTVAVAMGYWARSGLPRLPPNQAHQWMVLVGLPIVASGAMMAGRMRLQPGMTWVVRCMVAVVLPPLLLQARLRYHWDVMEAMAWLAGLSGIGVVCWWVMHRAVVMGGGRMLPMVLAVTSGVTAAATVLMHSLTQAKWSASLAAALLGGGLVMLVVRRQAVAERAAVDTGLPLTLTMVLLGWLYAPGMTGLHAGLLVTGMMTGAMGGGLIAGRARGQAR